MSRNIVICCDGTGNEVSQNLSNVLKLYRILKKNTDQIVFYDPGIGTLGKSDAWGKLRNQSKKLFGLATGWGLDKNVLDAYQFLLENYRPKDRVFLFGFSRGAYTVRMLAGVLKLIGLLEPQQRNLCGYALTAYKKAAHQDDFRVAWRFQKVLSTQIVPIEFMGIWDTVSSVIVPRPDRLYIPSLEELPYTKTNPLVRVVRHALAIDECRRMFRANLWNDSQEYKPFPFSKSDTAPQDVKQVWFTGVHSDVGGGYPESDSMLAKFPLQWMIDEASAEGLGVHTQSYNRLVLGIAAKSDTAQYVGPESDAMANESLTLGWKPLEFLPKRVSYREDESRKALLGFYIPRGESRHIAKGSTVHSSVVERMAKLSSYRPRNLPSMDELLIEPAEQAPGAQEAD